MPYSTEGAAQQIHERLKQLQRMLYQIDEERRCTETEINHILRCQASGQGESKLKPLYKVGIECTENEEITIRRALDIIEEIRSIRNECRINSRNAGNKEAIRRSAQMKMLQMCAQTLPLFVSKPGERAPPLCGAVPAESNYIAKVGDNVAALVRGSDGEDNWILAEVVSFIHRQNKYDIVDSDEEQNDRHVLSKRKVIPLPLMRANPETDGYALFPEDTMVMALYPQTTCFYKAIVHRQPKTSADGYEVCFEDNNFPNGYAAPMPVAQRYVIAYKPTKKFGGGGSGSVSSN